MSNWFLPPSVLYLIAGVSLGLFMAASHDHSMFPVHAHLNLLGWVSLGLLGMVCVTTADAKQSGAKSV